MPIEAIQHVQRMRGGSQSHLMRASDKNYYVVKFQNNPQHLKVLSNEFLATRLAKSIGLPVPVTQVVQVDALLIEKTPELKIQLRGGAVRCLPGLQFGSQYVINPEGGQVLDYLPEKILRQVQNLSAFAGILAIDKWTCNVDGRQAVFSRGRKERRYHATFIDQGFCFNAGHWTFPDSPLRGVYGHNCVYTGVRGWKSFEPWLTRLEEMQLEGIVRCARPVVPEWYGNDSEAMERLVESLLRRRSQVRELIRQFKDSSSQPFPNWTEKRSSSSSPRRALATRRAVETPPVRRSETRRVSDFKPFN